MKTAKRYDILKQQLLDYIKDNNLQHNDQLPTVRDIIDIFKFSYATVNRTLIEMEKEGLIFKHQGKGLFVNKSKKNETKYIGLIVPSPVGEYRIFTDILAGIKSIFDKNNINLLVSISNGNHQQECDNLQHLINSKIDGLIIFLEDNYSNDYSHIVELSSKKIPFVLIDRYIPELPTNYVVINNRDALFRICSYLKYNKQCENIFYIPYENNKLTISSSEEKIAGFRDAMKVLYANENPTVINLEDLITKINKISKQYKNFGLSFNHDGLALDFIALLQKKKLKLPSNCHIFGYNNSFDKILFPTVEQNNFEVGKKAAEIIDIQLANNSSELIQIKINPKLIIPDKEGKFIEEA